MVLAVLAGAGILVFSSRRAGDAVRQGAAIAARSFVDIFAPAATDTVVSEVNFPSPDIPGKAGEDSMGTSSEGNSSPGKMLDNGSVATGSAVTKYKNAGIFAAQSGHAGNAADDAVILPRPGAVPKISSPPENSSAVLSAQDAGTNSTASGSTVLPVSVPAGCSFPASVPVDLSRRVILNEIAWMGSVVAGGETADHAANREWIELKNISGTTVSLNGWTIMDAEGKIKVSFGSGDELRQGALYLLSRNGDLIGGLSADKSYSGALPNDGDKLAIIDASCGVSDFLDASAKWPGGSNATKQTLERTASLGWQTSFAGGGTPRAENSTGAPVVSSSSAQTYPVNVAISGDGAAAVLLKPGSIVCRISCMKEYAAGTIVTLAAVPGSNVDFLGWSGGCAGSSTCSFAINGAVSVVAGFRSTTDALWVDNGGVATAGDIADTADNGSSTAENVASSSVATDTASSSASSSDEESAGSATSTDDASGGAPQAAPSSTVGHAVIAEIQIAGAESSNDFVKIYNPTGVAVDMSGWKLRKKSATGTDASIREFPSGSSIAPGSYFIWANSADSFAQSMDADASSTATLAANNSTALFDETDALVDAVAWGTGTDQYVEGAAYPTNPGANQVLKRTFVNGAVIDTDSNSNDFSL